MSYQVVETVHGEDGGEDAVVVSYERGGATRYVWLLDAGEDGYATRSGMEGCSRYQGRSLDDVAAYAIQHAPGVRSCARLADARRAARRAVSP